VTERLANDAGEIGAAAVINLASGEFARAVDVTALGVPFVTPEFRQRADGKLKNGTVFAKQARGAMARWIAVSGVRTPDELRSFHEDGYRYDRDRSSPGAPWFVREVE